MSDPSLFVTIGVSALTGFISGLLAWAAGVFFGKPLARFFEIRSEVHKLMFISANIGDPAAEPERAEKAHADLRVVAAEIDAIRMVLPAFIKRPLAWCGFDLAKAATGLTGLSNNMFNPPSLRVDHRITARRALRLPVEPHEILAAKLARKRL